MLACAVTYMLSCNCYYSSVIDYRISSRTAFYRYISRTSLAVVGSPQKSKENEVINNYRILSLLARYLCAIGRVLSFHPADLSPYHH